VTELSKDAVRAATAYIDSWLAFRQTYLRVPGVQAAVLVDDEVVLDTAHGQADVAAGAALTPGHLFRIASHSKTFTATAVLQLAESGQLRLDDPLRVHLPWIADSSPKLARVTLRELLGHAGGVVRDGDESDFWQLARPFPDEAELRGLVTDANAVLEPNERFKYSNIGYSLLGLVIAAASGSPYNDYVTTNIVDRLGLANTAPELDTARLGDYANGYTSLAYQQHRVPIDHVDTRAMSAATGFSSTASDMCRYAAGHFRGDERLLTDASKRLMQHEEWKVVGGDNSYGLGLSIEEVGDRRVVGHGGGYPGHSTRTMLDPEARLAVSVLTNAIDGPAQELAAGIVKLINLIDPAKPELPDVGRFCGRFANLWSVLDITAIGGHLLGIRPGQADPADNPLELAIESDAVLRITASPGYSAPGETIAYDFDGERVRSIRGAGGMTFYPIEDFQRTMADRDRISVA
jgi:CubicO group peptidase (beta-lactamase class C family)